MKIVILVPDNRDESHAYDEMQPKFGAAPTALLEGFSQYPDHQFHIVCCVHQKLASPPRLHENIWYHSLVVPSLGWRAVYVGCVWAIRKFVYHVKPDIVHGQGTERYCALGAVYSRAPNVVTIHGNMIAVARALRARRGSFHWMAAHLESHALRKTNGVLCNSQYTELLVKRRALRTWRVPNALQKIFFDLSPRERKEYPPTLVCLANLSPYKRQLELLEWAGDLHRSGYKFCLQFIGSSGGDSYSLEFLNRVKIAEADGYARYLGKKDPDEVVQLLDASAGIIHVPLEEAFGLAPAEGLARNLKLFGSKIGGLIDIAKEVEGAELFEPNDWQSLKMAVARWLDEGAPTPVTAAQTMRDRYHPKVIAQKHLEIYREILAH